MGLEFIQCGIAAILSLSVKGLPAPALKKRWAITMTKPQLEIPVLNIPVHPETMDGRDPSLLRGDRVSGDRYYSSDFAAQEWEHVDQNLACGGAVI